MKCPIRKKLHEIRYPSHCLYGNNVFSIEESNGFIFRTIIESKSPFLIARLGTQECSGFWQQVICERFPFLRYPKEDKKMLSINTGMFSTGVLGRHFFAKMMKRALHVTDAVCFFDAQEEGIILRKYARRGIPYLSKQVVHFETLRNIPCPWTNALAGKKVLVVSPFADLIKLQYSHKDLIHNGIFRLPEFELLVFKAPLTQGGEDARFKTWKEALRFLFENTSALDFDLALIGCGSYGLPLQGMYKRIGKSSIYLGGALSPLFGVYGERWKNEDFVNEHWKRPPETDKPKCASEIEGGCYW